MISQLLRILRESIKAVPAMKYALAVAGVLAVVAMVGAFKLSPQAAVIGAVLTLVLMVAMVIFARLTTTAPRHFFLPVTVMMWAFLIVTVGTAFLLFTSAFFAWPRGLHELISPGPKPTPPPETTTALDPRPLIIAAQQQRLARDYEGAWATILDALKRAPGSTDVADEQAQIAMVWLRNLRLPESVTYATAVRPLTVCLHQNLIRAKGKLAADMHAHLGWANFLRYREGTRDLPIEEEYVQATVLDPKNPFAHAMWGFWLSAQRRPVEKIREHFQTALNSGRERPFVREFQIYALMWFDTSENVRELMRVADEMRRTGEPLAADQRHRIYSETYATHIRSDEADLLDALPPSENLATFRWLTEGRDLAATATDTYLLARLTETAGDRPAAAALYSQLLSEDTAFEDRIKAGLARCGQQVAQP